MIKTVLIGITTIIFYSVGAFPSMTLEHVNCTEDYIHNHLKPLNVYFTANENAKNMCLIIGGLLSDLVVGIVLLQWVQTAKTWRYPIAIVCLYLMRLLCAVSTKLSI